MYVGLLTTAAVCRPLCAALDNNLYTTAHWPDRSATASRAASPPAGRCIEKEGGYQWVRVGRGCVRDGRTQVNVELLCRRLYFEQRRPSSAEQPPHIAAPQTSHRDVTTATCYRGWFATSPTGAEGWVIVLFFCAPEVGKNTVTRSIRRPQKYDKAVHNLP